VLHGKVRAHVLAVILVSALFVVLALGVFFIAVRGGVGGARSTFQSQSRGGRTAATTTFVVVYLGFGAAIPIAILVGNHKNTSKQVGGLTLTAAEKRGRELFGDHCAVCHTLAAANAIGKVGPNLDTIQPPASLVLNTINNGCLPNPSRTDSQETCLGQGVMPAGLVQGKDAQEISAFVGRVAGKE